jgi:NitT/TauT family transport system substrate-binding protein
MSILSSGLAHAAGALGRQTLTVAHDSWIGYSGFYVALAQGYFDEAGLTVKEAKFSGPGDALPPLLAGHVDVALTTLYNVAVLAARGERSARAIYLLDTSNGADAIVASPSIRSVADLQGKDVAVTVGEVNQLLLRKALAAADVSESRLRIVDMNADDAGAALLAGRVQAAVTWEPWVSRALAKGNHVIYSSSDTPDLILDAVVVTRQELAARGDALMRFLRALDRGVAFLRAHPDSACADVARALTVAADDVQPMLAHDRIYSLADNRRLLVPDGAGPRALGAIGEFLRSRGILRDEIDAEQILTSQLLPRSP